MATTHIRKSCRQCGYKVDRTVYGYVKQPLGVPLTRCPHCGTIARDKERKEWIQMSPVGKFFAIKPRGFINAVAIAVAFTCVAFAVFREPIDQWFSTLPDIGSVVLLYFFAYLGALSLVIYYIMARFAVESTRFTDMYVQSIRRTRNANYLRLLEGAGKLYDEKLPFGIRFSSYTQNQIEYALSKELKDEDLVIPSLDNSVVNA